MRNNSLYTPMFSASLTMLRSVIFCAFVTLYAGTATRVVADELPPLQAIDQQLDMQRFAGDWYVVANIPVRIPFFNDSQAYNYTESYELKKNGSIKLVSAFNKGGFAGKRKSNSFTASVADDKTNAEWDVRFLWPFKARYLVIYLAEDYQTVIIAVPSRRWAWIMSRTAEIDDNDYAELLRFLADNGFNTTKIRRVPHAETSG